MMSIQWFKRETDRHTALQRALARFQNEGVFVYEASDPDAVLLGFTERTLVTYVDTDSIMARSVSAESVSAYPKSLE